MNRNFPWTDDHLAQLRSDWAEGLSAATIGRRLGVSKNAVVGKSHRLNLPARPSPIPSDVPPKPRAVPTLPVGRMPTLPPLPTAEPAEPEAPAGRAPLMDAATETAVRRAWEAGDTRAEIARRHGWSLDNFDHRKRVLNLPQRTAMPAPPRRSIFDVPVVKNETTHALNALRNVRRPSAPRAPLIGSLTVIPAPRSCQFPLNDGTATNEDGEPVRRWLFCEAAGLVPGRSYCPDHCRTAFQGFRDRRGDIAA